MNSKYLKYIFTEEPEKALNEKHIFNLFVFLVSVFFFIATIFNYTTDLGIVTLVSLGGAILLSSIYILSRFYVYSQKVVLLFIILSFINFNGLFFANFGFRGPIVYNFLALGMAILFFLNKKSRLGFILFLILNLIILAIIEYNFPNFFGYYEKESVRVVDHAFNVIFSLIILSLLFYLMIQYIETQKFKAEESDRLKSSFLANMSHEIRTPLNGIVGFSGLLNEENTSADEQSHFIEIIQSNSNHLAGLINDLIDISTIEAKAVSLTFAPLNLNSFMDQALKKFKTIITAKQSDIEIQLSQGLALGNSKFYVDKVRLNQILNNLVLNAISYSDSDTILIGYEPSKSAKSIKFFVKDKGIGINSEDQELIFKPFLKAKNAKYLSMGGTGIGLTIAKQLVELMGGYMKMESKLNQGTTFYFTLPYYKSPIDIPADKIS